jgi:hypothetical protein
LQKRADVGKSCPDAQKAEVSSAGTVSPALQEGKVVFAVKEAKVQDGSSAFKVQSVKMRQRRSLRQASSVSSVFRGGRSSPYF